MRICMIWLCTITFVVICVKISSHPCKRECNGTALTCRYHFKVESYFVLNAMACYQCPKVPQDCFRPDCILAGGTKRTITTVNRQFPGPTIDVCQYDTIEILVENIMITGESVTIHYHGQNVKGTPYMDGVPFLTQCPIPPLFNFTYRIQAAEAGTHFWHSHIKLQRGDGLYGFLIVHVPKGKNPHAGLYDEDLEEHYISIVDWTIRHKMEVYGAYLYAAETPTSDGILINGLGYPDLKHRNKKWPIAQFAVQKGKRYRFRFLNAALLDCSFIISVDNHTLTVISGDGRDIKPKTVTALHIYVGERYDVILEANQQIDSYWMRVKGLDQCEIKNLYQVGIITYSNSSNNRPVGDFPTYETAAPKSGLLFNPYHGNKLSSVTLSELQAVEPMAQKMSTKNVIRKFLHLSINNIGSSISYRNPYYGYNNVSENLRITVPQINNIAHYQSGLPILPNRFKFSNKDFCNNETESAKRTCSKEYCACTHVVELPLNRTVELVLFDNGKPEAHHPMHLHGYGFRVVAWKRLGNHTTRAEIERLDSKGLIQRNLKNAIIKDTVPVPSDGYAILRFETDNSGYWTLHCHVDMHADDGMKMVLKIGSNYQMKPVPKDFPSCSNYNS